MERESAYENMRTCVVCNRKINEGKSKAKQLDGLWICGLNCVNKFQKEKQKWTPEEWDELCKMQALYEKRKQAEINTAQK